MRERILDLFGQANHRRSVDVFVLGARYQGEVQLFWDDKPRKAPSGHWWTTGGWRTFVP
jgi:hypothetical protein